VTEALLELLASRAGKSVVKRIDQAEVPPVACDEPNVASPVTPTVLDRSFQIV
jgi:hypothetical protein